MILIISIMLRNLEEPFGMKMLRIYIKNQTLKIMEEVNTASKIQIKVNMDITNKTNINQIINKTITNNINISLITTILIRDNKMSKMSFLERDLEILEAEVKLLKCSHNRILEEIKPQVTNKIKILNSHNSQTWEGKILINNSKSNLLHKMKIK